MDKSRSHPTWVRGLKPLKNMVNPTNHKVAPYVGAWIETLNRSDYELGWNVAPYVGAWIETFIRSIYPKTLGVAPYVGAWIETPKR